MPRTQQATKRAKSIPPPPQSSNRIVGKVVMRSLSSVAANDWNPNRMTPFERKALRAGLEGDGWLVSQSLLIWGTDDKGKRKDVIIDGEQRWTVASEMGFKEAPMVFLDGVTESQAKALTVKLDSKRGTFDQDRLGELVREIQGDLDLPDLSFDLGIPEVSLARLLADPLERNSSPPENLPSGQAEHVRTVQLMLSIEQHEEFNRLTHDLAARYKLGNVTDVVLEAVRRAAKSK